MFVLFLSVISLNAQVSTSRMNEIRLEMNKSELEKIIGKSIPLKLNDGSPSGLTHLVFKGVVYELNFTKAYDDSGNAINDFMVYSISSRDRSLKTLSGISIGSSFDEVLNKYKNYNISIRDSWDENGKRVKTTRRFVVEDYDSGTYLMFTIQNGKVIEMSVGHNEGC